jgi:hypothetical protein
MFFCLVLLFSNASLEKRVAWFMGGGLDEWGSGLPRWCVVGMSLVKLKAGSETCSVSRFGKRKWTPRTQVASPFVEGGRRQNTQHESHLE